MFDYSGDFDSSTGVVSLGTQSDDLFVGMLGDVACRVLFIPGTVLSRRSFGVDMHDYYRHVYIISDTPRNIDDENYPVKRWDRPWEGYPPRAVITHCDDFGGEVLFISSNTSYYYTLDVDRFYKLGLGSRLKSVEFITAIHGVHGGFYPVFDNHHNISPQFLGSRKNLERFFSQYLSQEMFRKRERLVNNISYRRYLRETFGVPDGISVRVAPPHCVLPANYRPGMKIVCRDNVFPSEKHMYSGRLYADQFDISDNTLGEPVVIQSYGTVKELNVIDRYKGDVPRRLVLECTNPPEKVIINVPPHRDCEGYELDFTLRLTGKTPEIAYLRECMLYFRKVYIDDRYHGDMKNMCRRVFSRVAVEGNDRFPIGMEVFGYETPEQYYGKCTHFNQRNRKEDGAFTKGLETVRAFNGGWDGCVLEWFGERFCLRD